MKSKLLLSMIVKNEANRYLRKVLELNSIFADHILIIDDASTDETVKVCEEILKNKSYTIICNYESKFSKEYTLRKEQWNIALSYDDFDWFLVLDADEILDSSFLNIKSQLLDQNEINAFYFRLYDMWSETHYRDDNLWCAHNTFRPFLVRPDRNQQFNWNETNQHCGRFPKEIYQLSYSCHPLRIQHLGWSSENDRINKYLRYKQLDPNAEFGNKAHYESILDKNPNLQEWIS